MSFEQQVWRELSHLNVNDKTDKKGNLTYLSWSDCWSVLANHYPESSFEFGDTVTYPDESVEVWASVTIKSGDSQFTRKMPLPVMDYKNMAIKSPSARQVSDARMRCLVKTVAVATGLGLYLYRGEAIPEEGDEAPAISNPEPAKLAKPKGLSAREVNETLELINTIIDDPHNKSIDNKQIFQQLLKDPEDFETPHLNPKGKYIKQEFIYWFVEKDVKEKDETKSREKAEARWQLFREFATNPITQ